MIGEPAPRATFIVAAFNAGETLEAAVASALAQDEPLVEVIVVDDGSADGTFAAAEVLASRDPRVLALRRRNGGPGAARNTGAARARAPYLCFLDADDSVAPGKVRAQAAVLDGDAGVSVVYSDCDVVFEKEGGRRDRFPLETSPEVLRQALLLGADGAFPIHAGLVRKAAFDKVGGFREFRPLVEDLDLWTRLAASGARFAWVPEPRALYLRRQGSRSEATLQVLEGGLPILEWLLTHPPGDPGTDGEALRVRLRYRTVALAGLVARSGDTGRARRLLLRSLRTARSPGEFLEVLRLLATPASAAPPGPGKDGAPTPPPR